MVSYYPAILVLLLTFALWGAAPRVFVHAELLGHVDQLADKTFDFIIAGGGAAGSVLASRLSENPKFGVLLVEAGPDNVGVLEIMAPGLAFQIPRTYNWNFVSVPQRGLDNRAINIPRGHVLGGSTCINGMLYTRGSSDNYDNWARNVGDQQWSWKALWPYFKKHERWVAPVGNRSIEGQYDPKAHGYNGKTFVSLPTKGPDEHSFRCLNNTKLQPKLFPLTLDINGGKPVGLTWTQWSIGKGERSSAATSYLTPDVRRRPNLTILVNAYVTRVVPSSVNGPLDIRTVEIAPRAGGASKTLTAKKEVILSAGSFGTPRILLSSGIGNKTELDLIGVKVIHDLPDVGEGLTDHAAIEARWGTTATHLPPVDPAEALAEWQANRTGPLTMSSVSSPQLLWNRISSDSPVFKKYRDPAPGPNSPHIEMTLRSPGGPVTPESIVLLTPYSSQHPPSRRKLPMLTPPSNGMHISGGTVKINSTNPFDDPLIDYNFLGHPFDIEAFKEGIRLGKKFYSGPVWQGYRTSFLGPDPETLSEDEFLNAIKPMVSSWQHPVGTAAMSKRGSKQGVVNPDLRVKGVRGLRIVDASVIVSL
ncbi:pyranose dehydrogenase [Coprinopsis cinerea okayama7|uniref:pyranose dehydrogenase (acceptor) n=1 Tax=Coprinopsis cinerea (strain Okayama-7 / 130 / ATCC MYA-4618 / FGSC 9003) TaxID=240176 RepID=A8N894_COPC7|nr:pyranose dehydrogenase [Coprinopsis cinerea okayama7\|eukprot:XP_001831050.2 pyranose dehydrogenase [Coprinopsis cinerea okayama7\